MRVGNRISSGSGTTASSMPKSTCTRILVLPIPCRLRLAEQAGLDRCGMIPGHGSLVSRAASSKREGNTRSVSSSSATILEAGQGFNPDELTTRTDAGAEQRRFPRRVHGPAATHARSSTGRCGGGRDAARPPSPPSEPRPPPHAAPENHRRRSKSPGMRWSRRRARQRAGAIPGSSSREGPPRRGPLPAIPTDGMDDVAGRKIVCAGDAGFAGRTPVEPAAFFEEPGAGRAMDGAVHAAPAEQGFVRGVDDRIHFQPRDVAFDDFDTVRCAHGDHHLSSQCGDGPSRAIRRQAILHAATGPATSILTATASVDSGSTGIDSPDSARRARNPSMQSRAIATASSNRRSSPRAIRVRLPYRRSGSCVSCRCA